MLIYQIPMELTNYEVKVQISVYYGDFKRPVNEFERILKMINAEEFVIASIKVGIYEQTPDVEKWNLHLYTADGTRVSFQDAIVGDDGDSPRSKTFKILKLAGFNVSVEHIINATADFYIRKD